MPLYEYHCTLCDDVFERLQKMSDPPLKFHEDECGGALEKMISAVGIRFKGSGFYINDYGKNRMVTKKLGQPLKRK